MQHLEAGTSLWIFVIHSIITIFGFFWVFKLYKLSKAWKHIWIILSFGLIVGFTRRICIAFFTKQIDDTFLETIVMDISPMIIILCTAIVLMSLYFLFRKYLEPGGKLK